MDRLVGGSTRKDDSFRVTTMDNRALKTWLRSGLVAIALMLVCHAVAFACPNCKDSLANDPAQAGLVRGFFWSILLMVSMPFLILGGVSSYFYWEVCRARRARLAQSPFGPDDVLDSSGAAAVPDDAEQIEPEPAGVS